MGLQFHETVYGKNFFNHQLPKLSKALTRIANALEKQERTLQIAHCMENVAIDGEIVFQKGDTCILALNHQGTGYAAYKLAEGVQIPLNWATDEGCFKAE